MSWLERTRKSIDEENRARQDLQKQAEAAYIQRRLRIIEQTRSLWRTFEVEAILRQMKSQVLGGKGEIVVQDTTNNPDPKSSPAISSWIEFRYQYPGNLSGEAIWQEKTGFHKVPETHKTYISDDYGGGRWTETQISKADGSVYMKTVWGKYREQVGAKNYYRLVPSVDRWPAITYTGLLGSGPAETDIVTRVNVNLNPGGESLLDVRIDRGTDVQVLKQRFDKVLYEGCQRRIQNGWLPDNLLKRAEEEENRLRSLGYIRRG